ncbi:MAG: S-methyl-5'-thioadenosine phosphorylase [Deltaproteobacteria bacterium]|nr:MAG: S-methyl-5'-thioadenosine phosphorylase [Deltaproteobacteria bacterium]
MSEPVIGVIGGSGLYEMEELEVVQQVEVNTPFGAPSAPLVEGRLAGARLFFVPRHGIGHKYLPHEINYRANIFALKKMGVDCVMALSAVGSMREDVEPGHILIPNQFFDRTYRRVASFFGEGLAAHVMFGDPICSNLADILYESAVKVGATVHKGGTYICMEGPQFSTRAESNIYRGWGVDVIGMTNATEAKLAREAELPYSTVALVTDYDCWHDGEEDVSVDAVIAILKQNASTAQQIVKEAARRLTETKLESIAYNALDGAIMTAPHAIPEKIKRDLEPLIGKYVK